MVAPNYAALRSELAKKIGLGQSSAESFRSQRVTAGRKDQGVNRRFETKSLWVETVRPVSRRRGSSESESEHAV